MSEPADVRRVLMRYGLTGATAEPLGSHGGFSGARIWRVRTDRGDFCLKRWPAMDAGRHAYIARLIRSTRLPFLPQIVLADDGKPHVELDGRLWDLATWMPGVADFYANPSQEKMRAACVALARLHREWERFASPPQPCPAVFRRLIAAGEWLDSTVTGFADSFCSIDLWRPTVTVDPLSPWTDRARSVVETHLPDVRRLLDPWRSLPLPVHPCLCDVWHDHVLFTGDEVTGLIDYGAVKPDNVAADLARMLGSLVGDDVAMYEFGLDVYAAVRPLSEPERRLVRLLDRTGVVLGLANWLRRLFYKGCTVKGRAAAVGRIAELVRRAEKWASVEA